MRIARVRCVPGESEDSNFVEDLVDLASDQDELPISIPTCLSQIMHPRVLRSLQMMSCL